MREREGWRSPMAPESGEEARRCVGSRREISRARRRLEQRGKKEAGEESEGVL
jgi:hypothetical protein